MMEQPNLISMVSLPMFSGVGNLHYQLKTSDSDIVKYIKELLPSLKILFPATTWKLNMQP